MSVTSLPGSRASGLLLVALVLTSCGTGGGNAASDPDSTKPGPDLDKAADTQTCLADARAFDGPMPSGYPRDFPLPGGTVLYNVEDRGADGVIGTGVVRAGLKDVLTVLNGKAQADGYTISNGETEEHDAEANWAGNGYRGRWAVRDSATCDGEVVIQLLSKKQ